MPILNLLANYVGTIWVTLLQLLVIPLYIRFIGVESYGLLGVHTTLIALASAADLGLTPTLSREMARMSGDGNEATKIRSLMRSFELTYASLVLVVVVAAFPFFPAAMKFWLHDDYGSDGKLDIVFQLMLVQVGLQLVAGFYSAGLLGLQRHVVLNAITAACTTLRAVGGLAVLLVWPSLEALFGWMIIATVLQIAGLAVAVQRVLPSGEAKFSLEHLRRNLRYAGGITGIVTLSLLLTQIDKIILSRYLTLADFGIYAVAGVAALTIGKPIGPLFNTLIPRITQLVAISSEVEMVLFYHKSSQLASLLVVPAAAVLFAFAPEALGLWLQNPELTGRVVPIFRILLIGFACNSLVYLPYGFSLAYGWVRFGLVQNAVACVLMVPLTIWLVRNHGALGGSCAWAILNVGMILISMFFLHRRYLKGEYLNWYWRDVLPAVLVATLSASAAKLVFGNVGGLQAIAVLALAFVISVASTVVSLEHLRNSALRYIVKLNQSGVLP